MVGMETAREHRVGCGESDTSDKARQEKLNSCECGNGKLFVCEEFPPWIKGKKFQFCVSQEKNSAAEKFFQNIQD